MLNITLRSMHDPTRKILAIKALRAIAEPTETGTTALSLRAAKDIVDAVADGQPRVFRASPSRDFSELRDSFDYDVREDEPDCELAGFLLDVLCELDPVSARQIRDLPSYRVIAARVGLS